MNNHQFVAYYRVSTQMQGSDGLGMDAQRHSVINFIKDAPLICEFSEVESGGNNDRPELHKALALCRAKKATLVIAKLDRLARNAAFLLSLRDSGVEFVAVDMPHADRFTVGIIALVAERERELISQRTKDGLAAAKRRGTRLGNPNAAAAAKIATKRKIEQANAFAAKLIPIVEEIQQAGALSPRNKSW